MLYDGLDSMTGILSGLTNQQKVISNNIANANTPGYVRQEYSFTDVLGNLNNPFETNLSSKMGSMENSAMVQTEGKPVDLGHEMIEMQKVSLNYTMVTRRLTSVFNNIRRAAQMGR